ncbi:MAG: FAD-binding protein [Spirochaetaceae bacterium]|jgi:succinate dehydrogenase/fumarate reductase flavoprotein subunit|nr:FAD-binding protein [Spirochaetaceae bacterium]
MKKAKQLSRRDFLKGAATAAGAAAVGSLGACATGSAATGGARLPPWDKEVDVLVVGSGTAAFAALACKQYGAQKVLLIEKSARWGGTSAISGGGFWIPGAYFLKDMGLPEDNLDDALAYMKALTAGRCDPKLPEIFIASANKFLEWTHDSFGWQWTTKESFQDYYEPTPGYRRIGRTVWKEGEVGSGSGYGVWREIQELVRQNGIEVMMETAGKELVTDGNGAVIGAVAQSGGKELRIRATRAVLLGTGSFDHNPKMIKQFLPVPLYASGTAHSCTGDGHKMGQAIGADLSCMDKIWGGPYFMNLPFDPNAGVAFTPDYDLSLMRGRPSAIVVNRYGKRFGNESSAYAVFNRSYDAWDSGRLEYTNIPSFFICDSEFVARYPMNMIGHKVGDPIPEGFVQDNTLEGLARKLGIDTVGFAAEVAEFNANAVLGKDTKFLRGEKNFDRQTSGDLSRGLANPNLAPVSKAPFYGRLMLPGTLGTAGGLTIDEQSRVLNTKGEVIDGLYAVGNCSAGVSGGIYCGGGLTMGAGSVMSWVASRYIMGIK